MRKNLLFFVMFFITSALGINAQTELSGEVEAGSAPWNAFDVTYDLGEVATALSYADAAALQAALDAQEVVITATAQDGTQSAEPTSYYTRNDVEGYSYGCFWLNAEGKIVAAWDSEGVAIANHFDYDESNIIIHLLQNTADKTVPGRDYPAVITLTANGKSVVLKSTLKVAELPPFPVPTKFVSDLDVLDVIQVEVSQPVMKEWGENPRWTVDATSLIEDEEVEESAITPNVSKMLGVTLWNADASAVQDLLFVGSVDADFTANGGGYWLKRPVASSFYCVKSDWGADPDFFIENIGYDAESHEFYGQTGQMPNRFQAGDQLFTDFYFIYGNKAIKVEFTLTVTEEEAIDMPDPVTEIAKLDIVETAKVEVSQPVMKDWGENPLWTVDASKLLEAAGVEPSAFTAAARAMLFAQVWDANAERVAEEVSGEYTANGAGFWFAPATVEDVVSGDLVLTEECYRGSYGSSNFFIENVGYDAEENQFYGWAGQMVKKFTGGEHMFTNFYFIYGDKAIKVDFHFNVEEEKDIDVADMVKVGGSEAMTWVQEPRADWTGLEHWMLDMDKVSELLGCNPEDMTLKCKLPDGTVTNEYTTTTTNVAEGIYGFWIDATGKPIQSDANAKSFYAEYDAGRGVFNVGQMPNTMEVGDKLSATFWLCNKEKYYEVPVVLNIQDVEKAAPEAYNEVGSYSFSFRSLVNGEWNLTEYTAPVDVKEVMEKLGTEDLVVYAQSVGEWTKGYTCTPYPGFWFSPEGNVVGWSEAKVGIRFEGDQICMHKNPGATAVGDELEHAIYLVNEYTGAYVTLKAKVKFVDEIISYTTVGEMNVVVEMDDEEGKGEQEFEGLKLVKAIGAKDVETFLLNGAVLPRTGEGSYADEGEYTLNDEDDWMFDASGNVLAKDAESSAFSLFFELDDVVGCRVYADGALAAGTVVPADGILYKTDVVFQYDSYQYIVHVKLKYKPTSGVGIESVDVNPTQQSNIYNLNGQHVEAPAKGIYIIGGKKVYVK